MTGKKLTLLVGDDLLNPQDLRVDFLQRSQQATKNLQLLENSNADPLLLLRMTAWEGFSAAR